MKGHATKSTFIKRKYCMEKEWKRCWKMLMNLFLKIRVSRSKNCTQKRTFLGATQSLQSTWTLKKGDDKNIHAEVAGEASWAHRTRMPYCCMNTMWATGGGALQYPSMMLSWKKPPSSPVASVETLNTMDHTSQRIHNNIFADRVVRDKTGELQLNYSQPAWGEWWCRPHVGSESPKAPPAEMDQCWLWVLEKSVKNLKKDESCWIRKLQVLEWYLYTKLIGQPNHGLIPFFQLGNGSFTSPAPGNPSSRGPSCSSRWGRHHNPKPGAMVEGHGGSLATLPSLRGLLEANNCQPSDATWAGSTTISSTFNLRFTGAETNRPCCSAGNPIHTLSPHATWLRSFSEKVVFGAVLKTNQTKSKNCHLINA